MANVKLSAENWKIYLKYGKTLVKSWAQTHSKEIRQEKTHRSLEIQIKMGGEKKTLVAEAILLKWSYKLPKKNFRSEACFLQNIRV